MSAGKTTTGCLEPETLAAFAEGKLKRHEIPAVLAHLEGCRDCMGALAAANDSLREASPHAGGGRFRTWSLAAAAVIALTALFSAPFVRQWLRPVSPVERLVALAPPAARAVEPRLSGGFAWAPYRGPLRTVGERGSDSRRLKLAGVAGELVEQADRDGLPHHQHDAGVALVLIEQPLEAVTRLRAAALSAPGNAKGWSDLGAALYAAGLRLGRPSLYPEALAAFDRALRIEPGLPEARFNRALTLERLGLAGQAREAWQRYLEADPGSPWAAEAREHEKRLGTMTGAVLFEHDRPLLERAVEAGDRAGVEAFVRRHPQLCRTHGELASLGAWGEALRRGDPAAAARALAVARGIGEALVRASGESLLAEAVRAIDAASASGRETLAAAQVLYFRGRTTYLRQRPTEAEPGLRQAARLFAAAGSPMALRARYYAAETRFDQNDVHGARVELEALLAEADVQPRFAALGAEVRWELARCHIVDDDWTGAYLLLAGAESAFRRLGERNYQGFMDTMLASALLSLGRADEGWATRIRSFELLSAEGLGDRLAVSIGSAARMEARAGRIDPARALLELEQEIDRAAGNSLLLSNALVREAVLSAASGDDDRASSLAREALVEAERIADPGLRDAALADVRFAEGAAALREAPRRAKERLTLAIDFYRTIEKPFFLTECYLLRVRAALRLGETKEALRDVENGLATVERHRIRFGGGATGTGVVDAGRALLGEGLNLAFREGDVAGAFAYAERAQAQLSPASASRVSLAELQKQLAGSDTAVLELILLPDELVAIAVSERDRSLTRRPLTEGRLAALAARAAAADGLASGELYDLLLRPSERALAGARHLIVVAAPALEAVPYAALYDSAARRYLVETASVAVAPCASVLRSLPAVARRSVVALALPAGGLDDAAALPEAEEEIAEVGRLYREASAISATRATFPALLAAAPQADVLHIASHTERQAGAGDTALVFAAGEAGGSGRRVSWDEIAAIRLPPATVVCLAGCETLRRPALPQTRALSLGGGFLAAGASDVIGTLSPIEDVDARELFSDVHRHLAAGASPTEAVRSTQLAALEAESAGRRRTAWRALALLTRRIAQK